MGFGQLDKKQRQRKMMKARRDVEVHRMEAMTEKYVKLQRAYKFELATHYALFFVLGFVLGVLVSELHH